MMGEQPKTYAVVTLVLTGRQIAILRGLLGPGLREEFDPERSLLLDVLDAAVAEAAVPPSPTDDDPFIG